VGETFTGKAALQDIYHAGISLELLIKERSSFYIESSAETGVDKALAPSKDPIRIGAGVNINIFARLSGRLGYEYLITDENYMVQPDGRVTRIYPTHTVYAGLYVSTSLIPQDSDKDGVLDMNDKCPGKIEDRDGFKDDDGCPDSDNDGDSIPDIRDKCPNQAEDKDGFQDSDGCADSDNDNDGKPDSLDQCPLKSEDRDGFKDDDGCPDPDNDGDSIPDIRDKCPNQPEDKDAFQDMDGCPDSDNDGDGIPDVNDKCPGTQEIYNGFMDTDGCPDKKIKEITQGVSILSGVTFDNSGFTSASYKAFDELSRSLKAFPDIEIEIRVHTDSYGSIRANKQRSQKLAREVKQYLVDKGVESVKIKAKGMGEKFPIASNKTEQGRMQNRRVEIYRYQ
jgi:outer membrane protein OmpA-like peptidoglycan-associated protein